jgi:hypothetical protein
MDHCAARSKHGGMRPATFFRNANAARQAKEIGMDINIQDTAVVITDPQNDFLSEQGAAWPLVQEGVRENNTI